MNYNVCNSKYTCIQIINKNNYVILVLFPNDLNYSIDKQEGVNYCILI